MADTTVIRKCNCKSKSGNASDYQDSKYGTNMRVMNIDSKNQATCTICGIKQKL